MQRPWDNSANGDRKELSVAGLDWEEGKEGGHGDKDIARGQTSHSL